MRLHNKVSENLAMLVFASFLFMGVFGVGIGMETENGQMSSCPFMASQASMCQMSITEHISLWQQSFLGIPTSGKLLALALLLLIIVLVPFAKPFSKPPKLTPSAEHCLLIKKPTLRKFLTHFSSLFQTAFSIRKFTNRLGFSICGFCRIYFRSFGKIRPRVFFLVHSLESSHE